MNKRVSATQAALASMTLIGALFLLSGCSAESPTAPSETGDSFTVALVLEAELMGRMLSVHGATDLPDGAILAYEVRHEGLATRTDYPSDKLFADGHVEVKEGRYDTTVELAGWPSGEIEVWMAFQTILGTKTQQLPALVKKYGELGERLAGANVSGAGNLRRVELSKKLTIR